MESLKSLTDMEKIPIDIRRNIALNLSPKDLISLCAASKDIFYKGICNDNVFWRLKITQDYPEIMEYYKGKVLKNPKDTYIRTFSKISKIIEQEIMEQRVDKDLYSFIFAVYNDLRKKMPYKNREDYLNAIDYLMERHKNLYKSIEYDLIKYIIIIISAKISFMSKLYRKEIY